ncbi:MAG: DUF2600 family protein [Solirubrobacterales bacterium]|nr:DUF2600 family protein [Solirubrobacterales bacterium]
MLSTLCLYQARVLPLVRRELGRWEGAAASIPDPVLRRQALSALTEKASNVEAVAVFATLAPRSTRAAATRAIVALQVAIDYLDTLGEQPSAEPLRDGLRLHEALGAALEPGAAGDWYAFHPQGEDGGYLTRLAVTCQQSVLTLPSHQQVLPIAHRAAMRCGEAQSHTHAAVAEGTGALQAWSEEQAAAPVFRWWEIAAGASSSVAAHALIAVAATAETSAAEAEAIDSAYFPTIGALTVLLDDLVDREEDLAAGEHNYVDHYESADVAADRIGLLADLSRASIGDLPSSRRHAAILTGVAAFYRSRPGANARLGRPVMARLLRSTGSATRPLATFLRLRSRCRRPG